MKLLANKDAQPSPVVHIVDDDDSVRSAVGNLLSSVGIQSCTYPCAEDLLRQPLPDVPSCLLVDVRLQGVSGLDLQQRLASVRYKFPMILMTGHGDITMSVRAMKAGAIDFLPKPFRDQDLLDAVAVALANSKAYRDSSLAQARLESRYQVLTQREKQIMNLVVTGLMNKQIASRLNLQEITIKVHRKKVMAKMCAMNFAELVKMGNELQLV